ncbi:hypothetical protein ABW21_db0208302 [Orbilia brochopaga]|nr:hypothetical protein ABW21_db0208302 [Drechslerella brochopaga]
MHPQVPFLQLSVYAHFEFMNSPSSSFNHHIHLLSISMITDNDSNINSLPEYINSLPELNTDTYNPLTRDSCSCCIIRSALLRRHAVNCSPADNTFPLSPAPRRLDYIIVISQQSTSTSTSSHQSFNKILISPNTPSSDTASIVPSMDTPESASSSSGSAASSNFSRTTKASSYLSVGAGSKMTAASTSLSPRNRATSVSSTSIRGQCPECRDKRQDDLGLKVNSDALLLLAQALREEKPATLGPRKSGALDYSVEITFEDGVVWLAKIPKPWRCSHVNRAISSQAAAWRYLKQHTHIPVPDVHHFAYEGDPGNDVGVSFMLLDRLPGNPVPELDPEDERDLKRASRFHDQLSDIILELSACRFDKIGSLQQSSEDDFSVGPLYTTHNTYPLARGRAATNRGPFNTAFDYLTAFGELNYRDTKENHHRRPSQPDMCAPVDEELARLFLIKSMIPKFSIESGFDTGPFVFQNWGLSTANILVDDDCNITAVLGLSGAIGPLTGLCKYPDLIYETKRKGPLYDRKLFLASFLSREMPAHAIGRDSPLEDIEVRKGLLRTAHKVWQFENSILEPSHKHLHLRGRGGLYEYVFDDSKFSEDSAFKSLGDSDPDFQLLVPKSDLKGGEYSWDLPAEKKLKQRRHRNSTMSATSPRARARNIWEKAPWVKSRREEQWVREYVRVHRHLPPQVRAYEGKRRSNGPEKAFHMAWAFIRCRDASYMRRKQDKRKKVVRVAGNGTGGRNRSSSLRQAGKRVRGWSLTGDAKKARAAAKGKAPVGGRTAAPKLPRPSWREAIVRKFHWI